MADKLEAPDEEPQSDSSQELTPESVSRISQSEIERLNTEEPLRPYLYEKWVNELKSRE